MAVSSLWRSRLLALLVLLAGLLVASGPTGQPSEAAPATPQPQATVQRGAGRAGLSPTVLGDINNDGIVDIRDYGIWRQNFGQTDCGNPADLTGDCIVDIRDYGIWGQQFGQTGPTLTPTPTVTATPTTTPTPSAGTAVYTGNEMSNDVSALLLNATGDPLPPGVNTSTGGSNPESVAVNPLGTRLYVGNDNSNNVTVFTLNSNGSIAGPGTLVPLPAGAQDPRGVAVNPAGTRLYTADQTTNNVTVFPLNASGDVAGMGTNTSIPAGATGPARLTTNPAGTRLYVSDILSNFVTVFPLNASGDIAGAGTNVALPFVSTPMTQGALNLMTNLAGTRLYVAAPFHSAVEVFTLNAAGDIVSGVDVPATGPLPVGVATNPANTRLYVSAFTTVTGGGTTIQVFPLNASGDVAGAGTPVSLPAGASGPVDLRVNQTGTRLYIAETTTNNVTVFPLNASGDVAGPGTNAALGAGTNFVFSIALR